MPVTRVLHGAQIDFEGQTVGQLVIGDIAQRVPLRWKCTCKDCGTSATVAHADLLSGKARCLASICGKPEAPDTPASYRRKERDRLARLAAHRAAEEREASEAAAAKLAKVEADLTETNRKLSATVRHRLETIPDDEKYIDPATIGMSVSATEAREYNARQAEIFRNQNPDYYPCAENFTTIGTYLERNNIRLASARTLEAAFKRLRSVGMLRIRPAPAAPTSPPPVLIDPETDPNGQPTAPATPTPAPDTESIGFDQTGRTRTFTEVEVRQMSAEAYRRAFRLPTKRNQ